MQHLCLAVPEYVLLLLTSHFKNKNEKILGYHHPSALQLSTYIPISPLRARVLVRVFIHSGSTTEKQGFCVLKSLPLDAQIGTIGRHVPKVRIICAPRTEVGFSFSPLHLWPSPCEQQRWLLYLYFNVRATLTWE